jgi:hypothetical protein
MLPIRTLGAASCGDLESLSLPDVKIVVAVSIGPGAFIPPAGATAPFANLPAFCRVAGTIRPTADSVIQFETWMPGNGWNGRFQAVGNLGMSGEIPYATPFFSMAPHFPVGMQRQEPTPAIAPRSSAAANGQLPIRRRLKILAAEPSIG